MHPPTPVSAPSTHVVFNKDFLYLLPIQAKGGAQSGNRTQDAGLQGGLSMDRHSKWTLTCLSAAVLRTAIPTHGHRVNICRAPWASGSSRARRGQCAAQPPSPPGASSPPLPTHPFSPGSCLSGIIWGFFFFLGESSFA